MLMRFIIRLAALLFMVMPAQGSDKLDDDGDCVAQKYKKLENPLHVAIQGAGFFICQRPKSGYDGSFFCTRIGAFSENSERQVANAYGYLVLSAFKKPITIPPEAKGISISPDGTMSWEKGVFDRLGVFNFSPDSEGEFIGDGCYGLYSQSWPTLCNEARIIQGSLENSQTDPTASLVRLLSSPKTNTSFDVGRRQLLDIQDPSMREPLSHEMPAFETLTQEVLWLGGDGK